MEAGLAEEARGLWEAGRLGRQAREALGYKQIIEHLEGRLSLAEATEQIKIRTRRFAKQQRTWLRRFLRHRCSTWFDASDLAPQDLVRKALEALSAPVAQRPKKDTRPANNPAHGGNCS